MTPPPSKNVFSALRYRPFALLWAGQTLSRLGDTIYTVALAWWVLGETGSAETMSYVLLANVAPAVALGLFGGVIVDRLPRLRVMLAADVARTAINLAFAAGAASGELALWEVYVLSAAAGCCQAFFQPAYVAIVPEITPPERLVQANSLTTLSGQFGQILGPTIGALCIAVGGSELGFALNGITFAMSAVSLFWLGHLHIRIPRGGEGSSLLADLGDGLRTVAGQPWLWVTIVLASPPTSPSPVQCGSPSLTSFGRCGWKGRSPSGFSSPPARPGLCSSRSCSARWASFGTGVLSPIPR